MTYLMNTWYVAGWASELAPATRLRRQMLDQDVVLYRGADGIARALADRCPHRFVPLSAGSVLEDTIQCAYHGLRFGPDGRCVHNPHGTVPKAARVRSYPLVERYSLLWIWMGEPDRADAGLIPDFSFQDPAHWYVGEGYLEVQANYLLEIDNIMDLSHIQFLHPTTLGSSGVADADYVATRDGAQVWSKRRTTGEVMSDGLSLAMGVSPGQPVDRWINVRWEAPANMVIFAGAVPTGRPPSEGRESPTAHCFTPATASTTHYWFSICFPKAMGPAGEALAREQVAYLRAPFEAEDLPLLELQQRVIGDRDLMSLQPVLLAGDAGGVYARRELDRRIAAERESAA